MPICCIRTLSNRQSGECNHAKQDHSHLGRNGVRSRKKLPITFWSQTKHVLFSNWFSLLYLFVPAGFTIYYIEVNPIIVFSINFVAMVPNILSLEYGLE